MDENLNAQSAILKTIPKVYDDGLKPLVQESGKVVSLVPQAINAALSPLRKWILRKEYNIEETKILLDNKLKNVSADQITEPDGYVAIPALQAISYSMDSDELREMYANLLANSMLKTKKMNVHPSFVEIIKQMSPNDAAVFKLIFEAKVTPLIDLYIKESDSQGHSHYVYNISWIEQLDYGQVLLSIDSLIRLGLIEIPVLENYTFKGNYDFVKRTSTYQNKFHELESMNLGEVGFTKKYIRKTSLADMFYQVCIAPISE